MAKGNILIVVESPTKARTLTRFLGSGYKIEASMGHVRDLPKKRLGVNINDNFEPTYEVAKDKKEQVTKLKKLAKEASKVVLATDPDREGEAIAWHVQKILQGKSKKDKKDLARIVFHEITKTAIESAISHPRTIDMSLVDAQQGRRVLDRLVGYKLSPLLWSKTGKNWLSAGRVQSVAVRIIVEREREIEAFKPVEYWEVFVSFTHEKNDGIFVSELIRINKKKEEVSNKKKADSIVADLEKASYHVSSVTEKPIQRKAPPAFITSTLQRTASVRFGWSSRKTMTIAQNLYEKGKITYHRTDSVQLSKDGIAMARSYIEKEFGKEYVPEKPNIYATKSKVAQEAHEAIRPTKLGERDAKLGGDHRKLLDLITKRFLACQMNPQKLIRTTIEIETQKSEYTLRTSGEREVFAGWRKVYGGSGAKKKEFKEGEEDVRTELQKLQNEGFIPKVAEKDPVTKQHIFPEQKFTQPPPRYNEASLIKTLEELGIGRPSTYAPTISTIQARQYVEKNDSRAFAPTELGIIVNDFLVKEFDSIVNTSFTANMEDDLDNIANGEVSWQEVIGKFWTPFSKHLEKTKESVKKIKIPEKQTGEKCPECKEGDLVEKTGRYGQFIACNKFPECKYTKPVITKIDMPCPKCSGDIVLKRTKKGRKFFGCANYPKCDFASWTKPKPEGEKPAKETSDKASSS